MPLARHTLHARLRRSSRPLQLPLRDAARSLTLQLWAAARAMCRPLCRPAGAQRSQHSQHGQATTEYALVLLGAAAVALLLVAWATRTGAIGSLLDAVIASIRRKV